MNKTQPLKTIIILLIAAVLIFAAVFLVVRSNSDLVNKEVYDSSTTNLTEVYTQVKNNFVVVAEQQWAMLSMTADFIEEAEEHSDEVAKFIEKWQQRLSFTDFFFIDDNSAYCTSDDTTGIVDLGTAWKSLFYKGKQIVIDGSIPGKDAMMFFAVPTEYGTYHGFEYSAIAIAYDMATLNRELGVSAFDGQSSCYIVTSNGRVILQNDGAIDLNGNLLYSLKQSSFTSDEIDLLREKLTQGESGSARYQSKVYGKTVYMFYTPVGIEDWQLVAIVDASRIDASANTIQTHITIMLAVIFLAFAVVVIVAAVLMNRKAMKEKNMKIWQQNLLFKQMANHMNDIFVLYNTRTQHVEYISANTERVLGIPQQDAETNMRGLTTAFEHPQQLALMREEIEKLKPGAALETTQTFTNQANGEKLTYQVSAIREAEGRDLVSIIFSDRTKEEQSRKQIHDALMVAEHANKAKTTFLNNMSHDIRTPMNAIIGFTSLAASHINETSLVKDYLSKIMVSSNHLLSLINDVLDMSRIESGKVKIEEQDVTLPVIMHDLRNILQTDIKAKRLEFYIDTVDIVHESIYCDKLRVNQVLINLMSNAMKFTQPGGTVGIRVIEKAGAPEGYADYEFRVKDTGIGMSEEFAAHIFEPFTREENSTVSKIQGTGLGMAITKNIVDMMNGQISVKTKKGEGTEFIVFLRFRTGANKQEIKVIKNLEGFRALVADDSMDSCASVTAMLRTIGMRPEWTTSGKEAVYRATMAVKENDPFHAYIIDWLMPDMNGVEVVRRIRQEIGSQTPIIILTAYDWSSIEAEARAAGVTAFCAKPLFMSQLYNILQNAGSIPEAEVVETIDPEQFRGKKVLLVDDVQLNRQIAVAVLEESGIDVDTAENGQEAIDQLIRAKGEYDLILMDVMMPVMDGYTATRAIRSLEDKKLANIPIIAMTANAFEEDRQAALDAGMNDHLAKPFQIDKLYEMMKKFIS